MRARWVLSWVWLAVLGLAVRAAEPVTWPPTLPDGKTIVTATAPEFLVVPDAMWPKINGERIPAEKLAFTVAKTAPKVDLLYLPEQNYEGNPWSVWGDSLVATNGKYYASIGDHGSPESKRTKPGNAFVFEYDPVKQTVRTVVNVQKLLNMPETDYTPGKIHGQLQQGSDGMIYFATHRGSGGSTTDKYNYKGDWILRYDPATDKGEVVVQAPVEKQCIPATVLDPQRLIYYGGTAAGAQAPEQRIMFFAYDMKNKKLLYAGPNGCRRYFLFSTSMGRVYYEKTADKGGDNGELMRFDPAKGEPELVGKCPGIRAAAETAGGLIYVVSNGQGNTSPVIWSFNPKTEQMVELGPAPVGSQAYITSLDADPTGRYLYYIPGAHGGSERDGSAVVQFDTKTKQKKVIAFLSPYLGDKFGFTPTGTFSSALDAKGETLYITWHGGRQGQKWNCCALTVIQIPASERQP